MNIIKLTPKQLDELIELRKAIFPEQQFLEGVELMETSCYSVFTKNHDEPVIRIEFDMGDNQDIVVALDEEGRDLYKI